MMSDLAFAFRFFRRRPLVALTIVLTLGIAIGGGGAIFSVIDAVLAKPIAIERADRVVTIAKRNEAGAYDKLSLGEYWNIAKSIRNDTHASLRHMFEH